MMATPFSSRSSVLRPRILGEGKTSEPVLERSEGTGRARGVPSVKSPSNVEGPRKDSDTNIGGPGDGSHE